MADGAAAGAGSSLVLLRLLCSQRALVSPEPLELVSRGETRRLGRFFGWQSLVLLDLALPSSVGEHSAR